MQAWAWAVHLYNSAQVNSALHPSRVAQLSTSFGRSKGRNVISAGWQVTLCNPIWHIINAAMVKKTNANISERRNKGKQV